MEAKINWTAGSGQKIEIIVRAAYGLNLQGRRKSEGRMEIVASATVDGKGHFGHISEIDHPVIAATFGKIGLTQENYDRYLAAVAEVKGAAEYVANQEKWNKHEREMVELDRQQSDIQKRMAY